MTASIVGFDSRADLGMVAPRSVSRSIAPDEGGVTGHYFGPPVHVAGHDDCRRLWLGAQRDHMIRRGWVDIAYTGGYCQHGYALAGRGAGVRTAANGTNAGNSGWYAACWIGGAGETPTGPALDALAWWVRELRGSGGAADRVVGHRFHKPTACPGDPIADACALLDRNPIPGDRPVTSRHYAQAVIGITPADIEHGRVLAQAYQLGLLQALPDGRLVTLTHDRAAATAAFALLVGQAADGIDRRQFVDGTVRVAGATRDETAAAVASVLLAHPPDTIRRRGKPW